MKFRFLGRVTSHFLLAAAMLVPISCALGQTSAAVDAASGDDLTKRLEWLRAQVGKGAEGKATPAPGAPKRFSDTRNLNLRPAESRPADSTASKNTPVPAQKTVAQGPTATPAPAREKSSESKAKKASIAERSTKTTPAPVAEGPKTSAGEAHSKVAQAPTPTPTPGKTKSSEPKAKKTSIAERSTSATPAPVPAASKSTKDDARSKVARAAAAPAPVPGTPAPSRVASSKATPTTSHHSEALSLDTRFADLRSSSMSQPSKSLSSLSSTTSSSRLTSGANEGSSSVSGRYPWKTSIVTTVFWIGEPVGGNNFTPNVASSWDPIWTRNYGGYDNPKPEARRNFIPANFTPRQNPFYVALPYNDVTRGTTKPEARVVIPWYREAFRKEGQSVCRDRWVAVRNRAGRVAYAQWSDCGPFRTDHWQYVFGRERPKPNLNQGAGLDVSPAMRDFLGLQSTDVTDWKFVDSKDVPSGPWALYGDNNTFVQRTRFSRSAKAELQTLPEVATRWR